MAISAVFGGPQGYIDAINQAVNEGLAIYDAWKARQAHPLATEWVAAVQDPFGAQATLIVNLEENAVAYGHGGTADDAYFAQQSLIKLWLGYQSLATQFASNGPLYSQVIENSYKTLTPLINGWVNEMSQHIQMLGGISPTARLGVNVSHFKGIFLLILVLLFIVWLIRLTAR